ncbi:MAG: hypothetical protein ACO3P3_05320 [Candidatus Nanopelagicales bacterium]
MWILTAMDSSPTALPAYLAASPAQLAAFNEWSMHWEALDVTELTATSISVMTSPVVCSTSFTTVSTALTLSMAVVSANLAVSEAASPTGTSTSSAASLVTE